MPDEIMNSPDELYELIYRKKIKSLLLGNGFSLSHPKLGHSFHFRYKGIIKKIKSSDVSQIDFTKEEKSCPESFLDAILKKTPKDEQEKIRLQVTEIIINSYIESFAEKASDKKSLWELYKERPYSCEAFLSFFDHIYTLNYDPMMYFEFLKLLDRDRNHHNDGFVSNKDECCTKQKNIVKKLKGYKRFFTYLHGSYYINIDKNNNKLNKLKRNKIKKETLIERINDSKNSIRPFLIFEASSKEKVKRIKEHCYFKYCIESLGNTENNILVFGASFKKDDHILKALQNKNKGNIYVAYLNDVEKADIQEKISKENQDKFKWVKLNVNNCIWTHDEIESAVENGFDDYLYGIYNDNLSKKQATLHEAVSDNIPELIECIKQAESIDDLEKCECNDLYYDLIGNSILSSDISDRVGFSDIKTSLIISLGQFEYRKLDGW